MPFVYELTLDASEPDREFVQQLVPVGTLVGTGQALATLTDGAMEWHVPAARQGLLVEWLAAHGDPVSGGEILARIVCEGDRMDVAPVSATRLG